MTQRRLDACDVLNVLHINLECYYIYWCAESQEEAYFYIWFYEKNKNFLEVAKRKKGKECLYPEGL